MLHEDECWTTCHYMQQSYYITPEDMNNKSARLVIASATKAAVNQRYAHDHDAHELISFSLLEDRSH